MTMTASSSPSGSYRLRVTVGYREAAKVSRSDKREATFEADSLDDAMGEAEMWLTTYNEEYGGNWHSMDDIGLYDMAGGGLLATLGGQDGDDWEIIAREKGRTKAERKRIVDTLTACGTQLSGEIAQFNTLIARGRYDDACSLFAWWPTQLETMKSDLRKILDR
jgi:hypothetical protein